VLPSWYVEAFAESLGGPGAFRWHDGTLELTGTMSGAQRQRLADGIDGFVLKDLVAADVGQLWAQDEARARRFYVEAWGLLEFLRSGAGDGVAARFAAWEAMCRGKALGAEPGQTGERRRRADAREARQLFEDMFGGEYPALQRAFVDWARGAR